MLESRELLSIAFTCRLVADDVHAHQSITTASKLQHTHKGRVFADTALEPHAFFILSSSGTIHPVHFDASAFHTLLSALDGQKLFLITCPTSDTAPTAPNIMDGDPFVLMKSNDVTVYLVVLKPGNLL